MTMPIPIPILILHSSDDLRSSALRYSSAILTWHRDLDLDLVILRSILRGGSGFSSHAHPDIDLDLDLVWMVV